MEDREEDAAERGTEDERDLREELAECVRGDEQVALDDRDQDRNARRAVTALE